MKKCIAFLLAIVMVLSFTNLTVLAESTTQTTNFSANSVSADSGSTVDVNIVVSNNPGIIGAIIRLNYDDALTLLSATKGDAFSALEMTKPGKFQSPCQFTWDAVEIDPDSVKDGVVLTLTFEIPQNAESGTKYNIEISGKNGDIINNSLEPVNASFQSGYIEINGGGTINPDDPVDPTPTDTTIISVESLNVGLNNAFNVNVSIKNNPGIIGAILHVDYGTLILKNATCGEAFSMLDMTKPGKFESPCQFTWDSVDIEPNNIKDGVILTLNFELPENATNGSVFPITISGVQGDIIDKNLNSVSIGYESGIITAKTECEHNYVCTIVKAPDCINDGLYTYRCSICGDTYNETPKATGHQPVVDNAVQPTCTAAGLTEGSHCSVCKDVIVAQQTVNPKGHNFKDDSQYCLNGCGTVNPNYKAPSQPEKCSHKGYDTYEVITKKAGVGVDGEYEIRCSNCNEIISKDWYSGFASIKLSTTNYSYDGKVKTPKVYGVYNDGGLCDLSQGYANITYASGRKNVGRYKVTVKLKGVFQGSKTLYFTVIPKGTTLTKATSPKSKQIKAVWKKQTNQTTGYQVQVSTSSKFNKNTKTVTISKNKTTSATIKKLKGKKTYYVRVRTYKTLSGKKYYSNWSSAKKIKTKG